MDSTVNYIRQRLSLRTPLAKALDLTSQFVNSLSLTKPPTDPDKLEMFIAAELAKVKAIAPSVKKFDRDFPSPALSIIELYAKQNGKLWHYILIPHTIVDRSYSFDYIKSQTALK